jgi:hypothetical protein
VVQNQFKNKRACAERGHFGRRFVEHKTPDAGELALAARNCSKVMNGFVAYSSDLRASAGGVAGFREFAGEFAIAVPFPGSKTCHLGTGFALLLQQCILRGESPSPAHPN